MQAHTILAQSANQDDIISTCESRAGCWINQNWMNEKTTVSFKDGSVIVMSGPNVTAFDDMDAANNEFICV
jgi:hypothetical protein